MPAAPVRELLSTTTKMNTRASAVSTPRRSTRASPSQTTATTPHSNRLLRWFGWRMLPTARPGREVTAIQSPSAHSGANTCRMPIRLLSKAATTMPMQKARNAAWPRPARCRVAATCAVSAAAAIIPALERASDHGWRVQSGAARADSNSTPKTPCNAARPLPPGHSRLRRSDAASSVSQPPQPISAAAWFRKVDDGGRLKASSIGTVRAMLADTGHQTACAWGSRGKGDIGRFCPLAPQPRHPDQGATTTRLGK